jgi:phosphatidylglycerol:prolipoprotein diacylglycerol transferase
MKRGALAGRARTQQRPDPLLVHGRQIPVKPKGRVATLFASVENEVLAATFWFDPAPTRKQDSAVIRVSGQRVGVIAPLQARDSFQQDERVDGVVAGSGPVSVTARVFGINAGEWMVTATMLNQTNERARPRRSTSVPITEPVYPAAWSLRKWKLSKGSGAPVKTALLPFLKVPGVVPFFWSAMVALGLGAALAVQAYVISRDHLKIGHALGFSVLAIAFGVIGAKAWFVIRRWRERKIEGWCIQGFLAGIAVAGVVGFAAFHLPVGVFLDASAPGAMFGMAIGRVGCFLGGCCAGRPTRSRWGLWSVLDQRVGMRRIPTQFMESSLAFGIGLIALIAVLSRGPSGGAIFVAGVASYTIIRQGILSLRGGPFKSAIVARLTAVAAGLVLVADLMVVTFAPGFRVG